MTKRERYILEMMAAGGFIWYVDGRRWPYPALCHGRTIERITRVMLNQLGEKRWISEEAGGWDITILGRAALKALEKPVH